MRAVPTSKRSKKKWISKALKKALGKAEALKEAMFQSMGLPKELVEQNKCNGEWINDCPWPECECAKRAIEEMRIHDGFYDKKESENAGFSCLAWFVFVVLVIAFLLSL